MFDYIIIGGGSAGCVLAGRLSADPTVRVCLLEAGPADTSVLIHCPAGLAVMAKFELNGWGFNTTPQAALNHRQGYQPRGKVLGGSSSINGMQYVRGNAADYDGWAQRGCTGWSYDDVLPYFRKSECFRQKGDADYRGQDGVLKVEEARTILPLTHRFVEAAQQAGFKRTPDYNGAQQEGVGYSQMTRIGRRRGSTASASRATRRSPPGCAPTWSASSAPSARGGASRARTGSSRRRSWPKAARPSIPPAAPAAKAARPSPRLTRASLPRRRPAPPCLGRCRGSASPPW